MGVYRNKLPQLESDLFMTDGGLETTLIFHSGIDLPYFAAFDLLKDAAGTAQLRAYYRRYAALANEFGLGLVLESPTWRANRDWGAKLGYGRERLAAANRRGVALMQEIRAACESPRSKMVISGNVGPRADGYRPTGVMSAAEARRYHAEQIDTFADTAADMVSVFTMNYVDEAIGVALAARAAGMPVAVSFTLETDGRLPSGDSLEQAIQHTDTATEGYPVYYMINCAHPAHFGHILRTGAAWTERVRGLRANASKRSHAELDEGTHLDAGHPGELGCAYRSLRPWLPRLSVVGGCCGTDDRHVAGICGALAGYMMQ
jgi:S-methylmethionine-dependent homocysteine/selenocysteine methylase